MEGDRITNGTWNYILRLWPCCDCDISFSKWMLYCMSVFRRQNRIHPDLGPVFSIFSAFPPPPQYYLWRSRSVVVCIGQCLLTVGIPGPSSWHIAPCRWILCGWVPYVHVCVCDQGRSISHQMAPGLTTASYKGSCSKVLEQGTDNNSLVHRLLWNANMSCRENLVSFLTWSS